MPWPWLFVEVAVGEAPFLARRLDEFHQSDDFALGELEFGILLRSA